MKKSTIFLILCGGKGKRLWPVSGGRPKQFLSVDSDKTMLECSLERIKKMDGLRGLVLGKSHLEKAEKLVGDDIDFLFVEPNPKNTAPAIALATLQLISLGHADSTVVFMPCDQHIDSPEKLHSTLEKAIKLAEANCLVLIGVKPLVADSGLGYFYADESGVVKKFVEKPDHKVAQNLVDQGFLINSGIFVGKVQAFAKNLKNFCPELFFGVQNFLHQGSGFGSLPEVSFDKAVLGVGAASRAVAGDFNFTDLGKVETFLKFRKEKIQGVE